MCSKLRLPNGTWVDRQGELRAALNLPSLYAAWGLDYEDNACLCPVDKEMLAMCMEWTLTQDDMGDFIATNPTPPGGGA